MSAELLRRAAALMRERAEAATPGPWGVGNDTIIGTGMEQRGLGRCSYDGKIAEVSDDYEREEYDGLAEPEADAEHIASWHPAVALAVADWLDQTAAAFDEIPLAGPEHESAFPAFAVARLYLGEAADA